MNWGQEQRSEGGQVTQEGFTDEADSSSPSGPALFPSQPD